MAQTALLTIDQGTTNSKVILFGLNGTILAAASVGTTIQHPKAGWAEQSADDIRAAVESAIAAVLARSDGIAIAAIGISNQRESALLWDAATSKPLGPCVIWQCRRSAELCDRLRQDGHELFIHRRSGLQLGPMFSAGKIRWMLDHYADAADLAAAGQLRAGTVDAWLLWNLTGGAVHATDASNAARTQLMALDAAQWDEELAGIFGISAAILPEIRCSDALFGRTRGGFGGLPDGIPIHAMLGDSHAALFGHGLDRVGGVKVTLGTGSSLLCLTGERKHSSHGLSETVAWAAGGAVLRALEGNIIVSGHAAAFACELLGLSGPDALTSLADSVPDSDGVYLVPALAGLGAPHWDDAAQGIICGLSLRSRPAHVARAALDGIAHQICDLVGAIEADLGASVDMISVDGSAARNDRLMQLLADYSGRSITRPPLSEVSALGAARMAATALGLSFELPARQNQARFTPTMPTDQRQAARKGWAAAIARSRLCP